MADLYQRSDAVRLFIGATKITTYMRFSSPVLRRYLKFLEPVLFDEREYSSYTNKIVFFLQFVHNDRCKPINFTAYNLRFLVFSVQKRHAVRTNLRE